MIGKDIWTQRGSGMPRCETCRMWVPISPGSGLCTLLANRVVPRKVTRLDDVCEYWEAEEKGD